MPRKNDADVFMWVGGAVPRRETGGGGKRQKRKWGTEWEGQGKKGRGVERGVTERDRWRGGMWEGTDWWMNVCACHSEANAYLLHQARVSNRSDVWKTTGGGSARIQSSPLFSSSNPSLVRVEKLQNKPNKLFNQCLKVIIFTLSKHCALHCIKIIAASLCISCVTLGFKSTTGAE